MHSVKESHNALVKDKHPSTVNENRIKKNFDMLSLNGNEQALKMIKLLMNDFVLSSEKKTAATQHKTKY
jgi:hypothetical protein